MPTHLYKNRFIYIISNLLVLPAELIPRFDLLSNFSFVVGFLFLVNANFLQLLVFCIIFIIKNNANYRFNLLLKIKGEELSKSDYECVYLYAWCTLLRYFIVGIAVNQMVLFFK